MSLKISVSTGPSKPKESLSVESDLSTNTMDDLVDLFYCRKLRITHSTITDEVCEALIESREITDLTFEGCTMTRETAESLSNYFLLSHQTATLTFLNTKLIEPKRVFDDREIILDSELTQLTKVNKNKIQYKNVGFRNIGGEIAIYKPELLEAMGKKSLLSDKTLEYLKDTTKETAKKKLAQSVNNAQERLKSLRELCPLLDLHRKNCVIATFSSKELESLDAYKQDVLSMISELERLLQKATDAVDPYNWSRIIDYTLQVAEWQYDTFFTISFIEIKKTLRAKAAQMAK